MVSCVRNLLERALDMQNTVYLCFLGYRKVFDKVKLDNLIQDVQSINIDDKNLRNIINLYWNQEASIRVESDCTPCVPIE